jgi:hypothetical protein
LDERLRRVAVRHDLTLVAEFHFAQERSLRQEPGLPDGLFLNQKSFFEYIFEVLRLENIEIFCAHLEHFTDIRNIL